MGSATQFTTEITDRNNTYPVTILFTKKCHSAFSFASFNAISSIVTGTFFSISSLTSDSTFPVLLQKQGEIREIKTQMFRCHQRPCLIDMISQNLPQRSLEEDALPCDYVQLPDSGLYPQQYLRRHQSGSALLPPLQ